jgi:hypothetical protein
MNINKDYIKGLLKRLLICVFDSTIWFFALCFLFIFIDESLKTCGYAPLFLQDKEMFSANRVMHNFFMYKYYALIVTGFVFLYQMIFKKRIITRKEL